MFDLRNYQLTVISYHLLFLLAFFFAINVSAQRTDDLKAIDILKRSVENSGGMSSLDTIRTAEFTYLMISSGGDTISLISKKIMPNKYFVSAFSTSHTSPTTIYNNGRGLTFHKEDAERVEQPTLEKLSIDPYVIPEYAFLQQDYKLKRLPDQKFEHFDCYVVLVEYPLLYSILNYYDKKNFQLIMTIYPDKGRTLFTEYHSQNGISTPKTLILVPKEKEEFTSYLQKVRFNVPIESGWFNLTPGPVPEHIRTGIFEPSGGGVEITRTLTKQIESFNNGNSRIICGIEWKSDYEYWLTLEETINVPGLLQKGDIFKVKIISVEGNKFFCHYTSKHGSNTIIYTRK